MNIPHQPGRGRPVPAALALLAAAIAALGGCAWNPPQPWEKGLLAKPEMTLGGNGLSRRFETHIYTSKENASGGEGVGGGGCGCN